MPAFTNGAGGRTPQEGSGTEAGSARGAIGDLAGPSDAEQVLLDAALEFFGAAEAVIDYSGPERPRVRYDAGGLTQVRDAMAQLEGHIRQAHAAGIARQRIAAITRLDEEIVELILARGGAEPPGPIAG